MHIQPRKAAGFTLVELMITVAIVGILAAIAYPSYLENVRKGRRADAQAALMGLAGVMERDFLRGNAYRDVIDEDLYPGRVPIEGGAQTYTLAVTTDGSTYTLTATPTGAHSGDPCGNLTLASSGAQSDGKSGACWRR